MLWDHATSLIPRLSRDAWEPDYTPTFPLEVSTKLQDFPDYALRNDRLGERSSYYIHFDLSWAFYTLPKQTIEKHLHKKHVIYTRTHACTPTPHHTHTHLKKLLLEQSSWLGVGGGDLYLWTLLTHHKHIRNLTYKYLVDQQCSSFD